MKNPIIISLFAIVASLSSCSKTQLNTAQNERNAILSKQLEQSQHFSNSTIEDNSVESLTATASNAVTYSQNIDRRFENNKISTSQSLVKTTKANKFKILSANVLNELNSGQIKTLRVESQKYLGTKISIKKVQNPEKTQKTQEISFGQIITGIVVGAIGLALIAIVAAGLVPSVAGLVWTAGIIFFIAGVILVLVGMF